MGALGSILIAKHKKRLDKIILSDACIQTLKINSMVFILIGASLFSLVFGGFGGDILIENFLTEIPGSKVNAFLLVMITIFILGFFLDFFRLYL